MPARTTITQNQFPHVRPVLDGTDHGHFEGLSAPRAHGGFTSLADPAVEESVQQFSAAGSPLQNLTSSFFASTEDSNHLHRKLPRWKRIFGRFVCIRQLGGQLL